MKINAARIIVLSWALHKTHLSLHWEPYAWHENAKNIVIILDLAKLSHDDPYVKVKEQNENGG
jgi:exonuclease I